MTSINESSIFQAFRERMRGGTGRGRVYGYLMENADALNGAMDRIVKQYARTFDAFYTEAMAEIGDEAPVWLHTTSHDIFADALREHRYGRDALSSVASHWTTLFADTDMGAGRGIIVCGDHEVNSLVEPVYHTFRVMTQFSAMTNERRTVREALFMFHIVIEAHKTGEDPAVLRPLLLAVNETFHQFLLATGSADDMAETVEGLTDTDSRPEWQRHIWGRETGCQCEGCLLKEISTAAEYIEVVKSIGSERRKTFELEVGRRQISRYLSVLGFGRAMTVEGVSFESRLWMQRGVNTMAGAPQLLTREDLRRIVEDDALWTELQTTPSETEYQSMLRLSQTFAGTDQAGLGASTRVDVAVEVSKSIVELRGDIAKNPATPAMASQFGKRVSSLLERLNRFKSE